MSLDKVIKPKPVKFALVDTGTGNRHEFIYMPSIKGMVFAITTMIAIAAAVVIAGNRLKQVPIIDQRTIRHDKMFIKLCSEMAGNHVLLEELVRKQYPNGSATLIINQADAIKKSLEKELEESYTKEVK